MIGTLEAIRAELIKKAKNKQLLYNQEIKEISI